MKKRLLFVTLLAVAAMLMVGTRGRALAAATETPFKGTYDAAESYHFDSTTRYVDANGSANATYLGLYTLSYHVEVNLQTRQGIDSARFVAANGDELFATGSGQGNPNEVPGFSHIFENYTITGGTGRFAGASGSFQVDRWLNVICIAGPAW